jgi:hypothetical protein
MSIDGIREGATSLQQTLPEALPRR